MFFRLNTLQGTAKAPLNTLGGTKSAFETPKRYDEYPRPFYMGGPSRSVIPLCQSFWELLKIGRAHV